MCSRFDGNEVDLMEQIVQTRTQLAADAEVSIAGQTILQADPSSRNLARAVSHYIQGDSGRALQALEGAETGANENSLTEITAAPWPPAASAPRERQCGA